MLNFIFMTQQSHVFKNIQLWKKTLRRVINDDKTEAISVVGG